MYREKMSPSVCICHHLAKMFRAFKLIYHEATLIKRPYNFCAVWFFFWFDLFMVWHRNDKSIYWSTVNMETFLWLVTTTKEREPINYAIVRMEPKPEYFWGIFGTRANFPTFSSHKSPMVEHQTFVWWGMIKTLGSWWSDIAWMNNRKQNWFSRREKGMIKR